MVVGLFIFCGFVIVIINFFNGIEDNEVLYMWIEKLVDLSIFEWNYILVVMFIEINDVCGCELLFIFDYDVF